MLVFIGSNKLKRSPYFRAVIIEDKTVEGSCDDLHSIMIEFQLHALSHELTWAKSTFAGISIS